MVNISYELLILLSIIVTYIYVNFSNRGKDSYISSLKKYAIDIAGSSLKDEANHCIEIEKIQTEWHNRFRNAVIQLCMNPKIVKHLIKRKYLENKKEDEGLYIKNDDY